MTMTAFGTAALGARVRGKSASASGERKTSTPRPAAPTPPEWSRHRCGATRGRLLLPVYCTTPCCGAVAPRGISPVALEPGKKKMAGGTPPPFRFDHSAPSLKCDGDPSSPLGRGIRMTQDKQGRGLLPARFASTSYRAACAVGPFVASRRGGTPLQDSSRPVGRDSVHAAHAAAAIAGRRPLPSP